MSYRVTGTEVEKFRRSNEIRQEAARLWGLVEWAMIHRQNTREATWERSERQFTGEDGVTTVAKDHDKIKVNVSFSTINTIVPYVTGSTPHFRVEPYSGSANRRDATSWQLWLNLFWRSHEVSGDEHTEAAVFDALLYGDGYLQVSWGIDAEETEPDDEFGQAGVAEMASIFVDRVDPYDIWIDPASNGIYDARFVVIRRTMTVGEVKASKMYRFTDDLTPDTDIYERRESRGDPQQDQTDADFGLIDLFEVYDIVNRRMYCLTRGSDVPHRIVEGTLPAIAQLGNYRIPNSPYHMGELEQIYSLQQELDKTRSQMITHRRRNVPKWAVALDLLENNAIEALKSEEVGAIVGIRGSNPIDEVVKAIDPAQLSADAYQVSDLITRDVYEISGVNEYLRGSVPQISRTATEATIIESASNVKSQYKLKIVERFLRRIGQLILDTAFDVFPRTDFAEIEYVLSGSDARTLAREEGVQTPMGEELVEGTMRLEASMFEGNYSVAVESHSTELRSPQFKAQKYQEMFATLLQAAPLMGQLGMPIPNLEQLLRMWLEATGIEDVDSILDPTQGMQGSMMQQMMAQQAGGGMPGEVATRTPPQPGAPQLGAAEPPTAPVTDANSGTLPPQ